MIEMTTGVTSPLAQIFVTIFVDHLSNIVRVTKLVLPHCHASVSVAKGVAMFVFMNNGW